MLRWPLRAIQTQCLVPEEQELAASCTSRQPGVLRWGRATRSRQGISPSPEVSVSSLSVSFLPAPWSIAPCMQLESTVCFETKIKVGSLHCRGSPALLSPTPCALCLPCELGVQGSQWAGGPPGGGSEGPLLVPSDEGIKGRRGASTRSQH